MPKNRMKLKNKGDFRFLSTLFRFTHHSYSIFVHFSPDDAVRFNPLLFDDWRIAVRFSVIYAPRGIEMAFLRKGAKSSDNPNNIKNAKAPGTRIL